jgi:hypothetical protein
MAELTIFIVLLGDLPASEHMFLVTAPPSLCVGELKRWVHGAKHNFLAGYDAADLQVWKVYLLCSLWSPIC